MPHSPPIDLRSDTVTRPSPAMRDAMARAEVGDDVFGEDPTVKKLEARAAALLGKEAALFVPSGTMANQIGLLVHCLPGDEVLAGDGAHNYTFEGGAAGAVAGVQIAMLGKGGLFTGADVEAAYKVDNHHHPRTRLVCVENTHNRGGGRIWSPTRIADVAAAARRLNLALHLDGARLLNAAVALGSTAQELAAPFDTATLCFSKGLGAPVGSVIAGTRAQVDRAHRFRKRLGGAMRQAGILAAAADHALDHNVDRLADDHANARVLAAAIAGHPGVVFDPAAVETNLVVFEVRPPQPSATQIVETLCAAGVLCLTMGPTLVRFVTHLDVSRADCERAAGIIAGILRDPPAG